MTTTTATHQLGLQREGRYVRAVCSCGWHADKRRTLKGSAAATLDGSAHFRPAHQTYCLASPTIFDWTKIRGGCSCGWEGPWIERNYLAGAESAASMDASGHYREMLEAAWGGQRINEQSTEGKA